MSRYLVTIGTFDGVHRGHQRLMRWVLSRARRLGLKTRVVLFAAPPRFFLRPGQALPLLTEPEERARLLLILGIDRVEILRFGPRWARMEHTRFFEEYLVRRWRAGGLLVGRDFAFGKGRKGDLDYLRRACAARQMSLGVLPLLRAGRGKVSSSRVRELLEAGRVGAAAHLLGRPYSLSGKVERGAGLGRKLGFPTANVAYPRGLAAPPGVFAARVTGPGLSGRKAAANVGTRPTVSGGRRRLLEVHVPGFSGGLYGRRLTVEFLRRLRGERKFPSLDSLKRQIARDIRAL